MIKFLSKEAYKKMYDEVHNYCSEEEKEEMIRDNYQYYKDYEEKYLKNGLPWPQNIYAAIFRVKNITLKKGSTERAESVLEDVMMTYQGPEVHAAIIMYFKYGKTFEEISDFLSVHINCVMQAVEKALRFYSYRPRVRPLLPMVDEYIEPIVEDKD